MKAPKHRSAAARALTKPLYRQRVVKARKGKGAYSRKGRGK
jgi:stalled ribosome alternative rescue factor ArfA